MSIIKWVFIIVTIFHVPIYLFGVRDQFHTLFRIERSKKNHIKLTLLLTVTTFGIPIVYPEVVRLLGLIGGLCSITMGIVVPTVLQIRLLGKICILISEK